MMGQRKQFGGMWPWVQEYQQPSEAGRGKEQIPLEPPERTIHAITLIAALWDSFLTLGFENYKILFKMLF